MVAAGGDPARFADFGHTIDDLWSYAGEPCSNGNGCGWRGTPAGEQAFESCLLITDQFAYIPGSRAAAYFTSVGEGNRPPPPPEGLSFQLVASHNGCEWPEGRLTCGLLDAGVPLRVLRVHARIARRVGSIRRQKPGQLCKPGGDKG